MMTTSSRLEYRYFWGGLISYFGGLLTLTVICFIFWKLAGILMGPSPSMPAALRDPKFVFGIIGRYAVSPASIAGPLFWAVAEFLPPSRAGLLGLASLPILLVTHYLTYRTVISADSIGSLIANAVIIALS